MPDLDGSVLQAIGSLRVANWVYLKETRSYAVFLDPSGDSALGVLRARGRFEVNCGP